jgi:hypothetical protein
VSLPGGSPTHPSQAILNVLFSAPTRGWVKGFAKWEVPRRIDEKNHNRCAALQWRDTDQGHFDSPLINVLDGAQSIELIAGVADKLPATVGQRMPFVLITLGANVDMDEMERQRLGLYEELQSRELGNENLGFLDADFVVG